MVTISIIMKHNNNSNNNKSSRNNIKFLQNIKNNISYLLSACKNVEVKSKLKTSTP